MKLYLIQSAFGIDNLTLSEQPEPKPGPFQVPLKMRAFSLNYRDLLVVKGLYNPKLKLPFVPFSDGVGEVVALGPDGRPSFNALQNLSSDAPVFYYVFDVMVVAGRDVKAEPLDKRRALLETRVVPALDEPVLYSGELRARGTFVVN